MAGLEAFAGVAASTDAQKAALGKFIAQQGSQGVDAWKAEAAVGQQAAADARQGVIAGNPGIGQPNMASAVGPGQLTQMLAARASQPGNLQAKQGFQAAADYGAYTGLLGQANNNYADAVKGAAPIVESQTRSQVAQIQAELAAKRAQMQAEADDRAQARADAQRERDWANQDRWLDLADDQRHRQWELDDRRDAAKNGDAAPYGAAKAASSIGMSEKTQQHLSGNHNYGSAYQTVYDQVRTGMDSAQIDGIIDDVVTSTTGTPKGNYSMRALLKEQFRGLAGESLSGDQSWKTLGKEAAAAALAAEEEKARQNAGHQHAPNYTPPPMPGANRRTTVPPRDRPAPKGATLKPKDVTSWDINRIYEAMRALDENAPNYIVLSNELARRNGF